MKISAFIATSLDGFIARKNGALDWLPGSDGVDETGEDFGFSSFMHSVDALVMGRNTFEQVLAFGDWPYGNKPVFVLSQHLLQLPENIPDSVMLKSCTVDALCMELQQTGVKHIYVDGGKVIQAFINANLLDEITITRIPVIIGEGISLFGYIENDIKLQHLSSQSFYNGFVQSKYRIIKN